ncbi:HAMP domain-containing histidine kinase [Streptomyces sp. So13.3]|uniref:sensor histidine kinase n=1 Tax=Streptomyces TaxID=1883 RepID=UPI0011066155|nr:MULTISPECIES: HAMP domain-containing sensor histidine kinase [Streptomyces]MCZ4102962.1 HAMP domain-containing sensor histidine kinase [Streptomyces sp. H39-C1]QNA77060.1 HAMP domain-containing histidine kinase [Streptomyces sp. So13.3]
MTGRTGGRPGWRPRGWLSGIRLRLTLLAVLVVGIGLVIASVLVLLLVRHDLTGNAQTAARQRARDTVAELGSGALPRPPDAGEDSPVVQIVDRHGNVLASSPELRGHGPLLPQRATDQHSVSATLHKPPIGDGAAYWAVGLPADHAGQPVSVYAAASLEPVDEGVQAALSALLIACPALLLVGGGTAWLLVGRALRPVEAMRRQVAEITSSELDRRVPELPGTDELGRLARTMNAMLERLQQAGERQRQFVSDASHELRSPLAALKARTEVGLAHPAGTDWHVLARDVHRETDRLDRLVTELLLLSGTGAPQDPREVSEVDLDELVLLEAAAIRARGEVEVDLSGLSAVRVRGRAGQLRAVVRNLLDNAERHTDSVVRVSLAADENGVELVVADDGPGVASEYRERVFDRFFRVQGARDRDSGGVGLGLAIVRDVAAAHGGRAWIADSPKGAEFHVRLPFSGQAY